VSFRPSRTKVTARSGALVNLGAKVLQVSLDLLPVKARIEAANLVQGIAVLRHGTIMQYRRFPVRADAGQASHSDRRMQQSSRPISAKQLAKVWPVQTRRCWWGSQLIHMALATVLKVKHVRSSRLHRISPSSSGL
jgi:hypothetical protein